MATGTATTNGRRGHVRLMRRGEARRAFDRAARYWLGMSGAEFLRRWDAGEFADPDADPKVMHVAMLLPLGR